VGPEYAVLNPLLEELDGFKKEGGIFLIAATNRLDVLDEAILRPGRLDKRIEIGYPGLEARNRLFRLYLKGVPLCEGDEIAEDFDALMDECARKHEVISPADIKEICQRVKVRAAARQAQTESVGITAEDLRKEMEAWTPACAG
jgi:ATP-dependent 26S proteasome regulatory subunit